MTQGSRGPQSGSGVDWGGRWRRLLHESEMALILLVGVAVVGVGINEFSPGHALWFWMLALPLFALSSLAAEVPEEEGVRPVLATVPRALAHWGGTAVALFLVYLVERTGRMNYESAGLIALLVLALASFLAGVHMAWRFFPVGVVLGMGVIAAALVEQYVWMGLLFGLPVVLLVEWLIYRRVRLRRRRSGPAAGDDAAG